MSVSKKLVNMNIVATILILLSATAIGIFETGVGALLLIPMGIFAVLITVIGALPFVGPLLYYYITKYLFTVVLDYFGVNLTLSSDLIFYGFFVISFVYCVISSLNLIVKLALPKTSTEA